MRWGNLSDKGLINCNENVHLLQVYAVDALGVQGEHLVTLGPG